VEKSGLTDQFFIAIPNTDLQEIELQPDGWFTYKYKYGRVAGGGKKYVRYVPFDRQNISTSTYERFSLALPVTYNRLIKAGIIADAVMGTK
jgi:hypothetical protein